MGGSRRPFLRRLEGELHGQLHGTRRTGGIIELPEGRVIPPAPAGIEVVEGFAIKGVIHLPAELHAKTFGQVKALRKIRIPVVPSGIEHSGWISPNTALLTLGGLDKLTGIEVGTRPTREPAVGSPSITPVLGCHRVVAGCIGWIIIAASIPSCRCS